MEKSILLVSELQRRGRSPVMETSKRLHKTQRRAGFDFKHFPGPDRATLSSPYDQVRESFSDQCYLLSPSAPVGQKSGNKMEEERDGKAQGEGRTCSVSLLPAPTGNRTQSGKEVKTSC